MKTLLLITVCEQNKDRITNQIANLNKHQSSLSKFNITPIFVCGDRGITIETTPYELWNTNTEEKYTCLYKKILTSFEQSLSQEFDYLIKIDDDTLFNIDRFGEIELDADCIGRQREKYTENSVLIDLPMYNFKKLIKWYPSFFADIPFFFTGDFYILSRRVIEFIVKSKPDLLDKCLSQEEYIPEDQLIGYILKDQWNTFTRKNITHETEDTILNVLQITKSLVSLHPVHLDVFSTLMELSAEDQFKKIANEKGINYWYRKTALKSLEIDLKQAFFKFMDSKKLSGMG